jgi:c(7)-type cytochrome triheme protein
MRALQIVLGVVLVGGLIATAWFMLTAPTEAPPKAAPVAKADAPLRTDIPPPETIVFDNKYGKSTFTHKLHYDRVKGDCAVCHTKIFPQSRAPINYGKAQHRVAEAEGTACASCHRVGGTSFAADSHCVKCHEPQY